MSDDSTGGSRSAPATGGTERSRDNDDTSDSPKDGAGSGNGGRPSGGGGRGGGRRRRGSRGGRNRGRRSSGGGGSAVQENPSDDTTRDWRDPAADRGLTSEDVTARAAEDARDSGAPGDAAEAAPPRRPKIGDSRPAPTPARDDGSKQGSDGEGGSQRRRRRRRRGGRGRSQKPKVVTADLGVDEQTSELEELDDEVLERRKGRTRKGRPAGRYVLCVHVRPDGSTHIAQLEGRSLVEHYVSRPEDAATSIDGNIYLGKVQNVLPGMEAAFVDIGTPKNGVLYRSDVTFDPEEHRGGRPRIEQVLKNQQQVLVQAIKNPIGAKGARLTQEVSLAGRFVVMVPGQPDTYGISKRLPDEERKRLRRVLDDVRPADTGLIVRTAAEGATPDELRRDVQRLEAQWQEISHLAQGAKPPRLLYQEPQLALRIIREEFTKEYRSVVIDDRELYEQVRDYVAAITPELADRVELYEDDTLPLFERFHVHEQLHKALDRKVWLPSGGSLVIEHTEALTVIDVNTSKNVGSSNLEETVFRNNLEAAEEVARQLRLRDIGGIIVIDFIDMEIKKNRDEVLRAFKEALARDKTRTQVFEISELGLVEMTRKRISEGLVESFSRVCEECNGRGILVEDALFGSGEDEEVE